MSRVDASRLNELIALLKRTRNMEARMTLVQEIRQQADNGAVELDRFFLEENCRLYSALGEAQKIQEKLRKELEELCADPWYTATYVRQIDAPQGNRALVSHNGSRRLVGLRNDVDPDSIAIGEEVYLGRELNVIMAKSFGDFPRCGETACFVQYAPDGRMLIEWRGEKFLVDAAESLRALPLDRGDMVSWNRQAWMAFEKIEQTDGYQFLMEEIPEVGADKIGGQDENMEQLRFAIMVMLLYPDRAKAYGLDSARNTVILIGPPGTGKTLLSRIVASEVSRISGKKCRFGVVKPGEWEDPFVGVTQQKIRSCFAAVREAAREGFAVLFLDEVESMGRMRGHAAGYHQDRFTAALQAELDGFSDRGNIALISATNRADLLDPAISERLSDVEIHVNRPTMSGAEAIFRIHLPEALPYRSNGSSIADARESIIETAVSRFYSSNGENDLSRLRFRDGAVRVVKASELASGRLFEQICRASRRAALRREIYGGEPGLCPEDMDKAVTDSMLHLCTSLTVRNVHAYLSDLPQDVDVVSVEPILRKVTSPRRYLNVA